ncbi:uncharacterized protein N7515_001720 [Penicillium bovifimosum]|uniref:DUF659 domain-containing protein n=1 Tax=Penicillium bovifimosum TaxID=126998 RepID=A0A9W9HAH2_9EURO|nr:uncharacterized protein N7515_001720 [Penicillium bovifimosum]KAJ5142933.1 hypothetical protein N7515_001720 [Penicillium bovifimosum]
MAQKDQQRLLAMARFFFSGARPFGLFADEELLAVFQSLDPTSCPQGYDTIRTTLLDDCYIAVKQAVDAEIKKIDYLNIAADESTGIRERRTANLSVLGQKNSLYHCSKDIGDERMTTAAVADWIRDQACSLVHGNWEKLNAFITDASAAMISTQAQLKMRDDLKHVFFIPSDSHVFRLLMEDLLREPIISNVFNRAASIVKYFKDDPLKLTTLRTWQQNFYKKEYSLLAALSSQWGTECTEYQMLKSVQRSELALRAYFARLPEPDGSTRELQAAVNSYDFWGQLLDLVVLLRPVDEAIRESESGGASLLQVVNLWMSLRDELQTLLVGISFSMELAGFIPDGMTARIDRQLTNLHWTAYYLHPANHSIEMPSTKADQVTETIRKYCVDPDNIDASTEAVDEFFAFRARKAKLALRLFHTSANTVSERASSASKRVHRKIRNTVDADRIDKLVYIRMNRRALSEVEEVEDEDERELQQLGWEDEQMEQFLHQSRVLDIGDESLDIGSGRSILGKRSRSDSMDDLFS